MKIFLTKIMKKVSLAISRILFIVYNIYKNVITIVDKRDRKLPILDKAFLVKPTILPRAKYAEASKILLDNNTYLSPAFEHYSFLHGVPWNNISSSYGLYMHSFYDIYYLTLLYLEKKDKIYLAKATFIIEDWFSYKNLKASSTDKYIYCDHSVAMRSLSLLFYLMSLQNKIKSNFRNKIINLLRDHGKWLYVDENYSVGNHGLMMDRALLELGLYFNNFEWVTKAGQRINSRVFSDYTTDSVHLENSLEYHLLVTRYYYEIIEFLKYYDLEYLITSEAIERIKSASRYIVAMTMPGGKIAPIGDSNSQVNPQDFGSKFLHYVISAGKEGSMPRKGLQLFEEAGVVVYRESWEAERMNNCLWWSFKSGAKNPVHKQDDDMSFIISYQGVEIFSDPGKFNYNSNSVFRKFAVSPYGHNTVCLKDTRYFAAENLEKITEPAVIANKGDYIWLVARNKAYKDIEIERNFVFIKPNIFIIYDKITSLQSKTYSQTYLFGKNLVISSLQKQKVLFNSKSNKFQVALTSYIPVEKVNHYYGDTMSGKGFIFENFEQKTAVSNIEFLATGKNVEFLVSIELNSKEYKSTVKDIIINTDSLKILINDNPIIINI